MYPIPRPGSTSVYASTLFYDAPRWFLTLPWVEKLIHTAAVRFLMNAVVKPLVPTLVLARFLSADVTFAQRCIGLASMYAGLALLSNSRAGRNLEELVLDGISEAWQRFGVRPLLGLFWFIIDLFRRLMQGIERLLYTVDEWLRFRSGQSRAMLMAKGALGVIWFFVAYVVRFCVNLLIEPQLNPLKHIPWVSVSHKVMLPIWGQMHLPEHFGHHMNPFMAWLLAGIIVTGTPGIFGFLIWELKENWRLFAANRSKTLRPVLIGTHGETMPRLLRPGIHSGTIPKRFAKLRRAERKALRTGDRSAARKHREALHHVEIDLRRYIEREFVAWFTASPQWTGTHPQVGELRLATNEATIEVEFTQPAEAPQRMSFRLVKGAVWLDVTGPPRLEQLPAVARNVYSLAFINVLETADVAELPGMESGTATLFWTDWVAAWEASGDHLPEWARVYMLPSNGRDDAK